MNATELCVVITLLAVGVSTLTYEIGLSVGWYRGFERYRQIHEKVCRGEPTRSAKKVHES